MLAAAHRSQARLNKQLEQLKKFANVSARLLLRLITNTGVCAILSSSIW